MTDTSESDDLVTEFKLSDAAATPRYVPSPADGIDAVQLYGEKPAAAVTVGKKGTDGPEGSAGQIIVGIHCPLCKTRLHVPQRKVGQKVRCPDCHSEFTARASKPKGGTKSSPAPPSSLDEEVKLGEAVELPKYQPLARGTVTRADLDAVARLRTEAAKQCEGETRQPSRNEPAEGEAGGETSSRTASPTVAAPPIVLVTVRCPHCQTRLQADPSQLGTTIVCGDCHNPVHLVPTKAPARSTSPPPDDDGDELVVPTAAESEPARRRDHEEARRLLKATEAEEAERYRQNERETRSGGGYLRQLTEFLLEREMAVRAAIVALCVTVVLGLVGWLFTALTSSDEIMWIFTLVFSGVASAVLVMTWFYCSSIAVTITLDTADDYPTIENWPEGPADWVSQGAQIFIAVGATFGASAVASMALSSVAFPAMLNGLVLATGSFLLFPLIFLSMLEGNSLLSFISLEVLRSLRVAWWAWCRFYATSAVLLALIGLGLAGVYSGSILLFWIASPCVAGLLLIYFRAIGLLAERCTAIAGELREVESAVIDS